MSSSSLLVIARDPLLPEELRAALATLGPRAPLVHQAREARAGVEAARDRAPAWVVVELTSDLSALRALVQELLAVAPQAVIVAAVDANQPQQADGGFLIEALRCGVRDFLRRPLAAPEVDLLLSRSQPAAIGAPAATVGAVLSFISNKGGVGKSTLAVNTACGLALQRPGRVLLIDASLQMGVAAASLDLQPSATLTEAVRERDRLDETMLRQLVTPHESGLALLAAPRTAVEAAEIDEAAISRVITLARRTFDLVLVDTFPMVDGVVIAILDLSDRTYLVFENVVPTLLGGVKLVELLDGMGYPAEKQRIVLNRMTRVAGSLSADDVAGRLRRPVDFVLPYDQQVMVAANTGRPYVLNPSRWFGFGPPLKALLADAAAVRTVAGEGPR